MKQYILFWNNEQIGKGPALDRLITNANTCKYYDMYTGSKPGKYTVKESNSEEVLYTI